MGHEAAPHLSCVGSTREGIAEILATYRAQGIRRIVALRGDLPSGTATAGAFRYAADLIEFVRRTHGVEVQIRVGLHSGEVVVGKIGDDQLADWAKRNALSREDAQRALAPLL